MAIPASDFTAQANRAATELLADVDIALPVESYEILHGLAALAYAKGSMDAVGETAAIIRAAVPLSPFVVCPNCKGHGFLSGPPCGVCNNSGHVPQERADQVRANGRAARATSDALTDPRDST